MNQLTDAQRERMQADFAVLATQARQIDVIELAERIIADPRRTRVSLAGELALARAVEDFWGVAVEAAVLVRAMALPELNETGEPDLARQAAIETQAETIRKQLAALGGKAKE